MECKVRELVNRGHDQAAELRASCGAVDVRDVARLISDLATQLDVQLARSNALAAENAGDTSMEITRYRVYNGDENVEQYDEGAYVIYEDAMEIINDLSRRLRSVSAENVLLKSAHPQPFGPEMMKALDAYEKHHDETPETGMLDAFFILRDSIRVETPATDAFLAEVRASGIDYAIGVIKDCANNLCPGGTGEAVQYAQEMVTPYLDSIHDKLDDKSAQLRKGVQS